jgi:hypothetical protein
MSIKPIINHKHKYIFFMIPKNACSTVRHCLLKQIEDNENLEYNLKQLKGMRKINYHNLHRFQDYFWFAFLRNPFDRVIACYKDKVLNELGDEKYKPLYNPDLTFEKFVNFISVTPDDIIDWHLKSQDFYIGQYIDNMNFIGHVDFFPMGMEFVKKRINNNFSYGHLRKTKPFKKGSYFVNMELENKILIRYKRDFDLIRNWA